jgi:hypothetical protein
LQKKDRLTLMNLCQGGAEEVFQRDLDKVLENISDVNTPAEVERTITLRVKLKPAADRRSAIATFTSETKCCGVSALRGTVYIAKQQDGSIEAFPDNPNQTLLFQQPSSEQKQ